MAPIRVAALNIDTLKKAVHFSLAIHFLTTLNGILVKLEFLETAFQPLKTVKKVTFPRQSSNK